MTIFAHTMHDGVKNNIMNLRIGFVVFLCLFWSASGDPTISHLAPRTGSTAGGLRITLTGTGLPVSQFSFAGSDTGTVVSFYSNEDSVPVACDLHDQGCNEKSITCYTRRMKHGVEYHVAVTINDTRIPEEVMCADDKSRCTFKPDNWMTPKIDRFEAQSGSAGNLMVAVHGEIFTSCFTNNQNCPLTRDGLSARITRAYAPGHCELLQAPDTPFLLAMDSDNENEIKGNITCKSLGTFIGNFNFSFLVDAYGRSKIDPTLLRLDSSSTIFSIQTYPDINDITPMSGSAAGGTRVTINVPYVDDEGGSSGYTTPTKVYIGGAECTDVEVTPNENVQCTAPAQETKNYYRGNRGVFVESWSSLTDIDSVLGTTGAPESVDHFDETNVCDHDVNAKWIRMTGIFVVPFSGHYSAWVFGTDEAKIYIDQEEYGHSTGDWNSDYRRFEWTAGDEHEIVVVASPSACVEAKVLFFESQVTNDITGQAVQERQILRATSDVVDEKFTLKIDHVAAAAGAAMDEVQEICLTNGADSIRRIELFGVDTEEVDIRDSAALAAALNKHPFLNASESFEVTNGETDGCVVITFKTMRGSIPLFKVKPEEGCTVTRTQAGHSDNDHFTFEMNGFPSPLMIYNTNATILAGNIKTGLEGLFGVQCPAMFTNNAESYEEGPLKHSDATTEVPAFCGRYSLKNARNVPLPERFLNGISVAIYGWMCYAVRGLDNDEIVVRLKAGPDDYRWRRFTFSKVTDGDWNYLCANLKELLTNSNVDVTKYKLDLARIDQQTSTEDFYVDSLYFGQSSPLGSRTDIMGSRLGPALPNMDFPFTIDNIDVTYDDTADAYEVTLRPNDCGYDFSLLTLGGPQATDGDSSATSNTVTSRQDGSSDGLTLVTERVTSASEGLTGTFRVSYKGVSSNAIEINGTEEELKRHLEFIDGIGRLNVFRSTESTCANMDIYVEFANTPGDLPMLNLIEHDLLPSSANLEIKENIDGHLGINPLPGHMIFTKHSQPQVTVFVNGIPARCNLTDNNCGFTWSTGDTPTMTGIDITSGNQGDVLTIQGTGFSTDNVDNVVTIGGISCDVSSSSSTQIVCTLGNGPSGTYKVQVNVVGKGFATGDQSFTYSSRLISIDPVATNLGGGNELTVTGVGLSETSEIKIGEAVCQLVRFESPSKLICSVPAYEEAVITNSVKRKRRAATTISTVDVVLSDGDTSTSLTVDYNEQNAKITLVTVPEDLTVAGGQQIVLDTENLGATPTATLGDDDLTVVNSSGGQLILETPSPMGKGNDQLLRIFPSPGEGAITTADRQVPKLNVAFKVTQVYPDSGSLFGGTRVTITGEGFGDDSAVIEVQFGETGCGDMTVTNARIECVIQHTGETHPITNFGDSGYGYYYAFSKTYLEVSAGDSVKWTWEAPKFTPGEVYGIYETITETGTDLKAGGIDSGPQTSDGSFEWQFNFPGSYYIWSKKVNTVDERDLRMIVKVNEKADWKESLTVKVGDIEADYDVNSNVAAPDDTSGCVYQTDDLTGCTRDTLDNPDDNKFTFTFTKCRTPILTSVDFEDAIADLSRSGTGSTELTLSATGLSQNKCANKPMLDKCECVIDDDIINDKVTCTPADDCQTDKGVFIPVALTVHQYGYAWPKIRRLDQRSIAFIPLVNSFTPISGSTMGGTEVTFDVIGVTDTSSVEVLFKSVPAVCSSTVPLVCTSPPSTTGKVDVIVDGIKSACVGDCQFSYLLSLTPELTEATPASISSASILTITGLNLGSDKDLLSVTINGQPCDVISVLDTTSLTCSADNVAAGENKIHLVHDIYGSARSLATVTGIPGIDQMQPSTGSTFGGTKVTVSGFGFTNAEDAAITMQDGADFCENLEVIDSTLVCETVAHAEGTVTLSISAHGQDFPDQSFQYAAATTPKINTLSPSSGFAGTTLNLDVENFGSNADLVTVWVGNSECNGVAFVTTNQLSCTVGSGSSGEHAVKAHVTGKGFSNADKIFTYTIDVTSIDPTTADILGGQLLTLQGSGFTEEMAVTVCADECVFETLVSSNEYLCRLPARPSAGSCDVVATLGSSSVTQTLTYSENVAPKIQSMSPARGGTGGGTPLTLTGTNLGSCNAVEIDGVTCTGVTAASDSISCTTGAHDGSKLADVVVICGGTRAVWSSEMKYHYVDVWSSSATWGGGSVPQDGEMIVISEGQTVLLDTDTNILSMLLIDGGEVIFDETVDVELKAERVFINNGGRLQVGTEDNPFTKKGIITLYGHVRSKELPIYGTKNIAVRNGTIDLHGKPLQHTWTLLAQSASAGDTTITVQDDIDPEWKSGDEIAIATTGDHLSFGQNELHVIKSISGRTITLEDALKFPHSGETATFGDKSVEFRAEVILLTRNVLVRGHNNTGWSEVIEACDRAHDPGEFVTQSCFQGRFGEEIGSDQFGGHIIMHSPVMNSETVIGRFSFIELFYVGQAFRLGRYPLHFHLNGDMPSSYVKGVAVHNSFNRLTNIHGSNYINVINNVGYNNMGGNIFLEDGVEYGNVFDGNIVVFPRASSSLLNDDATPAAFWMTFPNNTVINNRCIGGTHFGFWYRLHDTPDGPSLAGNEHIRPKNIPLGIFANNVVHSMGWFGLWVFESYHPHQNGDTNNPPELARFESFVSWNNEKGFECVDCGCLTFQNFILVQNTKANAELKRVYNIDKNNQECALFSDSLVAGEVDDPAPRTGHCTDVGIVNPFGDEWKVKNIDFYNFDDTSYAMGFTSIDGTCTDQCGGYNMFTEGFTFTNVANRLRTRWAWEYVISDMDGSMCGADGERRIIPKYGTLFSTICDATCPGIPDILACPADVKFHRVALNDMVPVSLEGKDTIWQNSDGESEGLYRFKRLTHPNGMMVALADQGTYKLTWKESTNELVNISYSVQINSMKPGDCLIIEHELQEKPDKVSLPDDVTGKERDAKFTCADTGLELGSWYYVDQIFGMAVVGSDTSSRKKRSALSAIYEDDISLSLSVLKCPYPNCELPVPLGQKQPETGRPVPYYLWKDNIWTTDADGNKVADGTGDGSNPIEGDHVVIPNGMWVVIKDENPPRLGSITIFGGLEIDNETTAVDYRLEADFIVVIGGQLNVGWLDYPIMGKATISLTGDSTAKYDNPNLTGFEIGSKAIACYGACYLIGADVGTSWTTLGTSATKGSLTLSVATPSDIANWSSEDEIIVTSTSFRAEQTEKHTIQSINKDTGVITLSRQLQYNHIAGTHNGVTIAAAVGLLSRTVVVEGTRAGTETLGGRVLTSVAVYAEDGSENVVSGNAEFHNVEFRNMGQDGYTEETDPRFAVTFLNTAITDTKTSSVRKCSFAELDSTAIGIIGTEGLNVFGNVVYKPVGNGIMTSAVGTDITSNLVATLLWTGTYKNREEKYNFRYEACFEAFKASSLTLKNNYAVGSQRVGYHIHGEDCSIPIEDSKYSNNVAMGSLHGVSILPGDDLAGTEVTDCTRISSFLVYKNIDAGIYYNNELSVVIADNIVADNTIGIFPMVVGPPALDTECGDKTVTISSNTFIGTFPASICDGETFPTAKFYTLNSANKPKLVGKDSTAQAAITLGQFTSGSNKCPDKPCFGIMAYNTLCGETRISGCQFYHFSGIERQCKASFVIATNPNNDDLQHYAIASANTVDDSVKAEWKVFFNPPNLKTINPADCVDMACDAMKKVMVEDTDGTLFGQAGTMIPRSERNWDGPDRRFGLGDFRIPNAMLADPDTGDKITPDQLAPNGRGITRDGCFLQTVSGSDHYFCPNEDYNLLVIQSLDSDTETRRLSPVAILANDYVDLINGPQDHGWCSGYTCLKRVSLFHGLVRPDNRIVHVYLSSTQPDQMQYFMIATEETDCIVVAMFFLNPFRIDVFKDGTLVPANNVGSSSTSLLFDPDTDYRPTCDQQAGSNYIDRLKKLLFFTLKGSSIINLKRANVVVVSFKVINIDNVFGDRIVENLALILNIDLSKIRLMDVVPETSSSRRKRETDNPGEVFVEIGDAPPTNLSSDTASVVEYASLLMDSCQQGTISAELGLDGTECSAIILDDVTYTPTPPSYLAFSQELEPEHENVPFKQQPLIRAYDTQDNVVENLGIEEMSWEITATLLPCPGCHPNAQLIGTTTIASSHGWFNFTDLGISHKGDGYVIQFSISSPETAKAMNLTVESAAITVDGLPMTAGLHSMTVGDIIQDETFSMTLDLRDSSTDIQIPDLTWRDHTAFTAECDLVVPSTTGSLTGTLMQAFDLSTGTATFDDLAYSGYGLFYIGCHVESTPAEYNVTSVHKVFVLGKSQINIPTEATESVVIRYKLDFDTTLPNDLAKAQLHQATLEYFISKYDFIAIRESDITSGSILITFTVEGSSNNVTSALTSICEDISNKATITVGTTTFTLDSYMTVDGKDYYANCGKDDDKGLHPAYIALIIVLCLLLLAFITFVVIWRCKIHPNKRTGSHHVRRLQVHGYPDNGRTVFLASAKSKKAEGIFDDQKGSAPSVAPMATLYDGSEMPLKMRYSSLENQYGPRSSSNLTPTDL